MRSSSCSRPVRRVAELGSLGRLAFMDTVCWFMFLARPLPSSPEFTDTGGAFINVWVAHSDDAIAEQIARDAITEQAWRIEGVEKRELVSRDAYADDPEQMEHFEQALVDGHCLVFHCWRPDGEDSDDDTTSA